MNEETIDTLYRRTKEYYEKNAANYIEWSFGIDMAQVYQPFFEKLPLAKSVPEPMILDVGSGGGRDSLYFKEQGYIPVPIDTSEEICKIMKDVVGLPCIKADVLELPFEDQFIGIWACSSLVHVMPRDMKRAISNLSKAGKQGAVYYFSFIHSEQRVINSIDRFYTAYTLTRFKDEVLRHFPELELYYTSVNTVNPTKQWLNMYLVKTK